MTTTTTRNGLLIHGSADINFPYGTNTNMQTIDAALAKCNFAAATDPGVGDDSADGYSAGSTWLNTTAGRAWVCKVATAGAAVWWQTYPSAPFTLAADWDAGSYQVKALKFESDQATGTAPFKCASTTVCANLHAANSDALNGLADTAFLKAAGTVALSADWDAGSYEIRAQTFESDVATGTAPLVIASETVVAHLNTSFLEGNSAATVMSMWRTFPGSPTRVSDSQFTITDTSEANKYATAFPKGTVIKWEKSGGGFQCAMIKQSVYGTNAVTIDILGNDLVAGFTLMKYCIQPAEMDVFIVPGKLPAAASTDIGKTIWWPDDRLVFSALVRYKTACATTKGVWDVNDDGTSIFTSKPEIAATANTGADQISDCILDTALTVVAAGSAVTLDYDSGHATTPGSDAYVILYSMPYSWRYRT
jgi:hypothetical protein